MRPADYWNQRYSSGGNSGSGSYGRLAQFKAEIINAFIAEYGITSVIEFGCGDGAQLALGKYQSYQGFDISAEAVSRCKKRFEKDQSKRFRLMADYCGEAAELTLSLDVIYHLTEGFEDYMARLFWAARRFVVIYSTNYEKTEGTHPCIRHHRFTDWVEKNAKECQLILHMPNRYPFHGNERTESDAEFFIYERAS